MKPIASTFHPLTGEAVEVEVVTPPSSNGLCKVQHGGKEFARHKSRLTPVNESAREMLK